MECFLNIISVSANLCSIVALPVAVYQIFKMKNKIESTERGIKNIISLKENEKNERVADILSKQYQEIISLIVRNNSPGTSKQQIIETCAEINMQIASCVVEISDKDVENSLKHTIEHVEKYLDLNTKNINELKEARDYLNNAIQTLKNKNKEFESKMIKLISNSDEK